MDLVSIAQLLGNFGEFVGAVAVVATLIYVAIQIRQNSVQLRNNSFEMATGRYAGFYIDIADDPEKFDMWRRGLASFEALEPLDQFRFHTHMYRMLWAYRQSIESASAGVLPNNILVELKMDLASVLKCPGATEWRKSLWGDPEAKDEWSALFDDILRTGKRAKPINEMLPFLWVEVERS